jgi:hypothetical protein
MLTFFLLLHIAFAAFALFQLNAKSIRWDLLKYFGILETAMSGFSFLIGLTSLFQFMETNNGGLTNLFANHSTLVWIGLAFIFCIAHLGLSIFIILRVVKHKTT